jgi:hypothetical protein
MADLYVLASIPDQDYAAFTETMRTTQFDLAIVGICGANALAALMPGLKNAPPGAASLDGPIPCFGISIVPAAIIAQQLSTPGSPLNLIVGQNTIIQYNSDYANNRSGQGTMIVNNTQTTISWGPDNWSNSA